MTKRILAGTKFITSFIGPTLLANVGAGTVCTLLYFYLAFQSKASGGMSVSEYLIPFWLIAALVFIYWYWLFRHQFEVNVWSIIVWAAIFRAIGIWGSPVLEDDFYRFLLDGCIFAERGTPYGLAPSSLFAENTLSAECSYVLNWVNNPDLPTIYAPVLEYVFLLAYWVSPANVDVLQTISALFDLAIIFMLRKLAPARNLLLYAWSPLVVKEFAFTAHPDIIGVYFLFAAFILRTQGRHYFASALIGLACCTKVFAVLALPFFLFRQPKRVWATTTTTILLLYLPFVVQGQTDLGTLGFFAVNWDFNAFIFEILRFYFSDLSARVICAILLLAWLGYYYIGYFQRNQNLEIPRMDWIFGALLLFSPVINAWYLIWLLPFAVIRPSFTVWTASAAVSLSYLIGLHLPDLDLRAYEVARPAWLLEMSCIGTAFLCDIWRRRTKSGKSARQIN